MPTLNTKLCFVISDTGNCWNSVKCLLLCFCVCQPCPPLQAWLSNILLILLILCPFRQSYLQDNLLLFSDWFYSHRLIFSFKEETHLSPFEILLEAKNIWPHSPFLWIIFFVIKGRKSPLFTHFQAFAFYTQEMWPMAQLIFNAFNHLQFLFTYTL